MTDHDPFDPQPADPQSPSRLAAARSLPDRVKAILLTPQAEWARIDAEPTTIGDVFRSHVLPLAAIGPVATLVGSLAFGHSLFGVSYRPGVVQALTTAVVGYGFALVGIFVTALVLEWLAPHFGAVKDRTRAYKVAAYAATAGWLAGIFGLFPPIGFLSILGLYSLYLLWLGVPALLKPPADKATSYTVVSIVAMIGIGIVISAVTFPLVALFAGPATTAGSSSVGGSVDVPGVGAIDMGKIDAATKKLEDANRTMQNGEGTPLIPGATLQGLLPAALPGGLARTSVENSSVAAGGIGGAQAEAVYGSGSGAVRLSITDMGAMGAIAALGSAFAVNASKETPDGYERMGKVAGRLTTEKVDARSGRSEYGTIVADRVMVKAEGKAPIDTLKAAVTAIDLDRVATLTR